MPEPNIKPVGIRFQRDIVQTLTAIELLLANPQIPDFIPALRTQMAALLSWGEVLGIEDLVILAQTSVTLMRANPEQIPNIARLALIGFRSTYHLELQTQTAPLIHSDNEPQSPPGCITNTPAIQNRTAAPPVRKPAPLILVLDDSLVLREILASTLTHAGYQVLQAKDGQAALDQLHHHPGTQLAISDVEMPQMNGFDFLSHCRQDPHLAQLPIIMLSTYQDQHHQDLAYRLGADAYIAKPYKDTDLLTQVQRLLN